MGFRFRLTMALALLCASCAELSDPFETFYSPGWQNNVSPMPIYSGPPLSPGTVDPPVQYVQIISLEQAKDVARHLAAQGYRRIGMSMFESNWPQPHSQGAAEMGRKLGADLVLYAMIGAGTRLESVPHLTYEPGQSYSGTTSGFFGGTYGSFSTYGSTPGTFRTYRTTEEVGRYVHVAHYLKKLNR